MVRVNMYLTQKQVDKLKDASKVTGITMSELVRRILDEWLSKNK